MTYVAPLTAVEIHTLHEMHRFHPSRRARMRAHSLLLSHHGVSMPHIARISQVDYRSVSSWIDPLETRGFVGFYDQPGAGRRPTRSLDEPQKVQQYLQDAPQDFKQVVHQLEQETKKGVSTQTMKRLMKKHRYVWKRMRQAPAKSPAPHQKRREAPAFMPGRDRRWARWAQCPRAQQDPRSTRALNGRGNCREGSPGIHAGEDVPRMNGGKCSCTTCNSVKQLVQVRCGILMG